VLAVLEPRLRRLIQREPRGTALAVGALAQPDVTAAPVSIDPHVLVSGDETVFEGS
jgi:hypothetical protein